MQYGRWGSPLAALVLVFATTAHAEVRPCSGTGGGGPTCPPPISCSSDAMCFSAGAGRCLGGFCDSNCGALFECNDGSDCPSVGGLVPHCQMVSGLSGANGVCAFNDGGGTPVVTLCGAVGSTLPATVVSACFSAGANWFLGDCDGDGIPNGSDADPCNGAVIGTVASRPNPFCLGGQVCEGTGGPCGPILRCTGDSECLGEASHVGATMSWQCLVVPGTSTHICQPSCGAVARCMTSSDCGPFGSACITGTGGGFCSLPNIGSCASMCATSVVDFASPSGDCDHDGMQNGCDTSACTTTTGPTCVANPAVCTSTTLMDAGVIVSDGGIPTFDGRITLDAGSVIPDASISLDAGGPAIDGGNAIDGGASEEDAFTPDVDGGSENDAGTMPQSDAGQTAMDASAGTPVDPHIDFGGGGGCRCSAAGGGARSLPLALSIAISLALLVARRRR